MDLLARFKEYLFSQDSGASKVTVKNYVSDINHFVAWFEARTGSSFNPGQISLATIEEYKKDNLQVFSSSSLQRHLSSLRKFFKFAKEQNLVTFDPFTVPAASKADEIDPWKLKEFKSSLYEYNAAHLTIKNYIIDIKQFIAWAKQASGLTDELLVSRIDKSFVEEYKKRLMEAAGFSPATVNRKLSSLRKYLNWAHDKGLITEANLGISNIASAKQELYLPKAEMPTEKAPKEYSKFPPLRLFQKFSQAAMLAFDAMLILPLASFAMKGQSAIWKLKGQPVFKKGPATFVMKNITPQDLLGIKNISKRIYAPGSISTKSFSPLQKLLFHLRYTRPNWYKRYHSYAIAHYLNFAVLIIVIVGLAFGFYNGFVKNSKSQFAANVPTAPNRVLSFQGRLTDNNDNPITGATNLRFAIYTSQSGTGSGTIQWQEVDQVTPDSDGIFNVVLGNTTTTCANPTTIATGQCAISQNVFTENNTLFLGVTVESTAELTPRQQIATVAFADNARTLQGLVPITATSSGTTNVVLALDSSGNLTIGGTANPVFSASGGQFKLSGQPLLLTTNSSSNGNLVLTADGLGHVDVQHPLQNNTLTGNLRSSGGAYTAAGAVQVEDMFGILASSSGQSALTIDQEGQSGVFGPVISASVSGSAVFTVDNSGNISNSGNITTAGTTGLTLTGQQAGITFTNAGGTGIHNITASAGTLQLGALTLNGAVTGNSQSLTGLNALSASGTITFAGLNTNGGIVYTTGTGGQLTQITSVGTNTQCLLGGTTPSFGSCGTGTGANFWTSLSGALYPTDSTSDLLIGSNASSSADFAFTGLGLANHQTQATFSGNLVVMPNNGFGGNASIAAQLVVGALAGYPSTIQTTLNQSLTIGGNTTGNIFLMPRNGAGTVYGDTASNGDLTLEGTSSTTKTSSYIILQPNAGNVGIGTTAPAQKLDIASGNLRFTQVSGPGAPTAALAGTPGNLTDGTTYFYRISYVTSLGETALGTASNSVIPTAGNEQVNLTNINTSANSNVTARKIYRIINGQASYRLIATINDNTTTTYTDNIPDAQMGLAGSTTLNTTAGDIYANTTRSFHIDQSNGNLGIGTGASATLPPQKLFLATGNNFGVEMAPVTTVNAVPYLDPSGILGTGGTTVYYFKVVALEGSGNLSMPSGEASCTVDGVTTNACSINWTAVQGASSYRVYAGEFTNGEDRFVTSLINNTTANYFASSSATLGIPPIVPAALVDKISAASSSWFLGGNIGIGTAAPTAWLHIAPPKVASTAATTGTAGTTTLTVTGQVGGDTFITTTGIGGAGAPLSITTGAGGTASAALIAATGGAGGTFTLGGGVGGLAGIDGTGNNTGGAGGTFSWVAGTGGAATGNTTGTNLSGAGGAVTLNAGSSGASSNLNDAAGNITTAAGGNMTFTTGGAGTASYTGVTNAGAILGGNGGLFSISGGAGGAASVTAGGTVTSLTGGTGSTINIVAGTGGAANLTNGVSNGSINGGDGGPITIRAGTGGVGLTKGGTGGLLTLAGGNAPAIQNATGGAVTVVTGAGSSTGTGGNGGTLTLTGSAAGGDNTVNRSGGSVAISAGASKGPTQAGAAITLTSGAGGQNLNTGTTTGPSGGGITITTGAGGTAPGADTTSQTGGTAGTLSLAGGTGAAATSTTLNDIGGGGGAFSFIAGTGGAATSATSGNNTGGAGGAITIRPGSGGAASNGSGTNTNGTGGLLTLQGGTGGAGTGTAGGTGGGVTVQGGTSGISGANGGQLTLAGGQGGATGTGGVIVLQTALTNSLLERMRISANGTIGLGNAAPISELHVTRALSTGVTGKALAVFDQIENQDILTASAGGSTIFTITRAGGIGLGIASAVPNVGNSSQCLLGGATASWGSCSTNGYWALSQGALTPFSSKADVLIGSNSTASADFAFTGLSDLNNRTQASISGQLIVVPNNGYGGKIGIGTTNPSSVASGLAVAAVGNAQSQDLVNLSNATGQEPTAAGVNALQLTWLIKPSSGNINGAQRINVTNANTGTGGLGDALRLTATGPGGVINSPTVGLLIDGLTSASTGTTAQNAIQIGANWDSSIKGDGDLRINANGNIILATSSASTFVGIGNPSPRAGLDIGTVGSPLNASVSGDLTFLGTSNLNTLNNGSFNFRTSPGGDAGLATKMTLLSNGNLGIGTTTPISELHVTRPLSFTVTGKALTVFDQIENQDILTASAGGSTIFTITRAGGIGLGIASAVPNVGTNTQCLLGGSTATWGSCNTGSGANLWTALAGALSPIDSNSDLLIGGSATSSAEFAFTGLGLANHQTQASISGQLIVMPNNGYGGKIGIGTTNPSSLANGLAVVAVGGAQSQDLVNFSNTTGQEPTTAGINALQLTWNVKPSSGNLSSAQRINVLNNNTGTAGQAQGLRIIATGAGGTVSSDTDGILIDSLANPSKGTTTQNAIEIGTAWDSSIFGQGDIRINASGNIIFATSSASTKVGIGTASPDSLVDINLGTSSNLQLTYNDNNGSATTYSRFGIDSSGNLTIDNTGTKTIIADDLQVTGNHILDSGAATRVSLGATTTLTNTGLTLSGTTTLTASSLATIALGVPTLSFTDGSNNLVQIIDNGSNGKLNVTGGYQINGTDGAASLSNACVNVTGGIVTAAGTCPGGANGTNWLIGNFGALFPTDLSYDLLVGGNSTNSARFHIYGNNATTGNKVPAASASASTLAAAFVVNNDSTGNLFTASASGSTRFIIDNNGSATQSGSLLTLGLLGGNAPTIQGTANSTLTIGGNTTGNIILSPNNGTNGQVKVNGALNLVGGLTSDIDTQTATTLKIGITNASGITLGKSGSTTTIAGPLTTTSGQNITLGGFTGNNAVLYATTSTGVLTSATTSTANQCLLSGASAGFAPSWGACALGTNWWNLVSGNGVANGGYLAPINDTVDVLLGGQASTSAAFKVTGQGNPFRGTQVAASVSANTSFAGLVADQKGVGDIFAASRSGETRFVIGNDGSITQNALDTSGNGYTLNANFLTTGKALAISSTSTQLSSGGLQSLDWSPGSATTATGDLLSLNVGANGIIGNIFNVKDNGSSVFSVSQAAVTANIPASFNSAGDVGIAYDINFTNPTASYIKSQAPLYITSGETFNSSDLNISTYNKGNVIINSEALSVIGSATVSGVLTGQKFVDYDNGTYYIDPAASGESLKIAGTTVTASNLTTIDAAASLAIDSTTLTLGGGSAATIATTTNGLTLDSGSNTLTFAASDTTLTTSLTTFNIANTTTLAFKDGTNTLCSIADGGTTGNFSCTGTVGGSNLSGTNTGDQTITLTGDVTGSGTGSFATTIAANAVALATDTTGNYVATIADNGGGDISVANSGTENAAVTLGIVANSIGNTELAFDTGQNLTTTSNVTFNSITAGGTVYAGTPDNIKDNIATCITCFILSVQNTNGAANQNILDLRAGTTSTTDTWFITFEDGDGTNQGEIRGTAGNAVSFTTSSDIRLKENIRDTHYTLADLMKIKVRDFNWISDGAPSTGFIAQELYTAYPDAVIPGGDDPKKNPWTVSFASLIPVIIKSIQDQQLTISNNTSHIASMDADLSISNAGNLNIVEQNLNQYIVTDTSSGRVIDRVATFAQAVLGSIRAGIINTKDLVVSGTANIGSLTTNSLNITSDSLTIAGQNLRDYISSVVNDVINGQNLISPIASVDQIHTNVVSPMGTDSKISLKLDKDKISIINNKEASGSAVTSFDNLGNATLSGNLNVGKDATIAGVLHASKIIADQIEGLNIKTSTISANYITNNYYSSSDSAFPTLPASAPSSTSSGNFSGLFAQDNYINIASFSSQLASIDNLSGENAIFNQNLTVFGQTTLSDTSIVGQLAVGGNLILADRSINVLGSDLNLQPLRQGGLSIMSGLIYIDTNGNVKFGADATINGTLYANEIAPLPNKDLTLRLASDSAATNKLVIKGASGSGVLAIDNLGNLIASGAGTFSKLNLNNIVGTALAVSPTEVVATGSAGTVTLKAHKTEVTVNNTLVTKDSLIYITPLGSTGAENLFLSRQVPDESFTVGISNPISQDTKFNFLIVN